MRSICVILLIMISGCGGEDSESLGFSQQGSGDAAAIPPGCGAYAEPTENAAALLEDQRWLPLHELYYRENDATLDLCELFRTSPADIVVLQFASLPCYRCMKWIDEMATGLKADAESTGYQHVVLGQPSGGESDEEWEVVKSDVAPDARWIRDYEDGLWEFFSVEDQAATDPLAVVFNRSARGFFTLDTALDFAGLKTKIGEILEPAP